MRRGKEGACGRLPAFRVLVLAAAQVAALFAPIAAADACGPPVDAGIVAVRFAIDGDTVRLSDGRNLRLIGINTLETGKHGSADEPFAVEAERRLGELLRRGPVRMRIGPEPADRYGRVLAELWSSDGQLISASLAAEGLGLAVVVPPNIDRIDCVVAAERVARAAHRGLWAEPGAWSVAASVAPSSLRGFKRVTGTVTEVHARRGGTAVILDGRVELWFPDLPDDPTRMVRETAKIGASMAVRGWWGGYRGRPSLRIEHPALVERTD